MKYIQNQEDSCYLRLSFCLILGAVLGTLFCNGMDGQMKAELGTVEGSLLSAAALRRVDFRGLFFQVLGKRIPELLLVLLVEITPIAPALLMGIAGYLGFSTAVMVCALTMDAGLMGIVRYLVLISPQCLFYIPVLYLLFLWIPRQNRTLRPAMAALLFFAVLMGTFAESYINPWIVAVFLR